VHIYYRDVTEGNLKTMPVGILTVEKSFKLTEALERAAENSNGTSFGADTDTFLCLPRHNIFVFRIYRSNMLLLKIQQEEISKCAAAVYIWLQTQSKFSRSPHQTGTALPNEDLGSSDLSA